MNSIVVTIHVRTFGEFSLIVNGSEIKPEWHSETAWVLFCSLLSPMDEYISQERLCRTLWGVTVTRTSSMRLMGMIHKLRHYFLDLAGFDPFIINNEGIALDQRKIVVDANLFRAFTLEGLQLLARGKHLQALERLQKACSIYRAPFLPGVPGKLVDATRDELDGLYGMVVADIMPVKVASHQ